jgi:hypothetical protein
MKKVILALAAAAVLAGCQTMPYQPYARAVKVEPQTAGVIALKNDHRDEDRAKAQSMMEQNCAGKTVKVLEEGEVVIGTTTDAKASHASGQDGQKVGSLFGIPISTASTDPSTSTSSTTMQKTEWQIKYKCASGSTGTSKKSAN